MNLDDIYALESGVDEDVSRETIDDENENLEFEPEIGEDVSRETIDDENENLEFEPEIGEDVSRETFIIQQADMAIAYETLYDAVYDAAVDAISTYAQTVTDGQSINSAALTYFQGILQNQLFPVDYVIYVGNPYNYGNNTYYEYCLAYGDLSLSGTKFTGNATIVTMRNSSYYHTVNYSYNQSISLDAPLYYSRSNLGDYSGVYQYDWSGFLILLTFIIGGLVWIVKKLLRLSY